MCGIAGLLSDAQLPVGELAAAMAATLRHRGPDDAGVWSDAAAGVALAHRRLSIIDLTPEGHQPKHSHCGRFVITYNGEIYNFLTLQAELRRTGHVFRGRSDTEVLLTSLGTWGLGKTLSCINGMYAFALWDRDEDKLTLVRDRLGKKPLYFGWVGGAFVFASELKAIRAFPGFANAVDRDALTLYLRHNCIPAPYSIYQGVYKLPPGSTLTLKRDQALKANGYDDVAALIRPYWSARTVFENGLAQPFMGSEAAILDGLDTLLRDVVAVRMLADVPLGAFLSGGIDSSLVVALMQAQSTQPVKTFTIGFHEAAHNEAVDAARVARHLGTEHHELYLSPQDALDVVPRLPTLYDEPFADSSQIPTFLVSQFAREHVTVALSGDGGDELFGGYNRYVWAPRLWDRMKCWPLPLRRGATSLLNGVSPETWSKLAAVLKVGHRAPADKVQKIAACLPARSPGEVYKSLVSHWERPDALVHGGRELATLPTELDGLIGLHGFAPAMMYADMVSYLPDDILVKVDRASMAVGLEARAPLLDYRVAEFAARVPFTLKIKGGQGKYLLRRLLYRYVPAELVERPKMGFEMPIAAWLRGPLREWAEALLDENTLKADGYLDPGAIRTKWQQHIKGQYNWQFHLWDILMFQAWREAIK